MFKFIIQQIQIREVRSPLKIRMNVDFILFKLRFRIVDPKI
jgi:hypothetical protein